MNVHDNCRRDLRQALSDKDGLGQVSPDGGGTDVGLRAAFDVVKAVGYCRLYGVRVPKRNLALSSGLLIAATKEATKRLRDEMALPPAPFEEIEDPVERDDFGCCLLSLCMDVWAVGIALDKGYLEHLENAHAAFVRPVWAKAYEEVMDEVGVQWDLFSRYLESAEMREPLLVAGRTNLLKNWRHLLAPKYKEVLPWWLDGRLEP